VASQTKVKHTVGGLLKSDSSITVDDNDTANTLNKFLEVFLHKRMLWKYLHLELGIREVLSLLFQ